MFQVCEDQPVSGEKLHKKKAKKVPKCKSNPGLVVKFKWKK